MENVLLQAYIIITLIHMQDSANVAENWDYRGELYNYIAVVTQPGSAIQFRNPQTVLANGHEAMLKEVYFLSSFGGN